MMNNSKPLALIIEDNEDQNLIFTTALKYAGYDTVSIRDGITAQKKLMEEKPDIVILDLHLPGVHGEALLGQIRSDPRLADVRVVLATADGALGANLQAQANLVLLKPISFTQLNKLAGRFLQSPKSDN